VTDNHKAVARGLIAAVTNYAGQAGGDTAAMAATAQIATTHALLALVEQQELANLIAAYQSNIMSELNIGLGRTVLGRITAIVSDGSLRHARSQRADGGATR
jgi:hypothetical protein